MVDKGTSTDKSGGKEGGKTPTESSSSAGSKELEKPTKSQHGNSDGKTAGSKELEKPKLQSKSAGEFPSNINVPHGQTVLLDISKRTFYAKSGDISDKNSKKSEVYPTIVNNRLEVHPLEEFKKNGDSVQIVCGNKTFDHKFPAEGFMLEIYQESHYNPPPEEHRAVPKSVNYDGILCDLTKGKYYEQSSMKRVYPFVRYPEQVMIFRPIPLLVRSQSGAQVALHESLGHAVVSSDETGIDQYYYHYAPPQPIKLLIKPWDVDSVIKK